MQRVFSWNAKSLRYGQNLFPCIYNTKFTTRMNHRESNCVSDRKKMIEVFERGEVSNLKYENLFNFLQYFSGGNVTGICVKLRHPNVNIFESNLIQK